MHLLDWVLLLYFFRSNALDRIVQTTSIEQQSPVQLIKMLLLQITALPTVKLSNIFTTAYSTVQTALLSWECVGAYHINFKRNVTTTILPVPTSLMCHPQKIEPISFNSSLPVRQHETCERKLTLYNTYNLIILSCLDLNACAAILQKMVNQIWIIH